MRQNQHNGQERKCASLMQHRQGQRGNQKKRCHAQPNLQENCHRQPDRAGHFAGARSLPRKRQPCNRDHERHDPMKELRACRILERIQPPGVGRAQFNGSNPRSH
jgi:hypothetical protein